VQVLGPSAGTIVERVALDEFGVAVTYHSGSRGASTFARRALVRFGGRDYDPVAARWTIKDPVQFRAGDPDLYRYAFGDPIKEKWDQPRPEYHLFGRGEAENCKDYSPTHRF
jgi:RHS repeat-associated protein